MGMTKRGVPVFLMILVFVSLALIGALPGLMTIDLVAASDVKVEESDASQRPGEESFIDSGFADDPDGEDLFDDVDIDAEVGRDLNTAQAHVGGFLKEELAYRLRRDDPAWSKVRTIVNVDAQGDLGQNWRGRLVLNGYYDLAYALYGRDRFTSEALAQQESELELRDTFVEGLPTEKLMVKLGRQIIPWGQSEFVQITDIANPRDQTEFAMVDLEDARLPVWASRVTWMPSQWELTLAAVHEMRPNKTGAFGTDFYPYQSIWADGNIVTEADVPSSDPQNTEWIGRLQRRFNGADLSLVAGDYFDDRSHLDFDGFVLEGGRPRVVFTPEYKRIQMAGVSGDKVLDNYLFKFDSGYFFDTAVARNDLAEQLQADPSGESVSSWQAVDLVRALVGVEYSGIDDLRLTVEGAVEHIPEYDSRLQPDQTTAMLFFLANYQTLNQTLDYNFQWGYFSQYREHIYKLVVTYDIRDAVEISLGAIYYGMDNEDSPLYPFREENRVFGGVKYSF